MSANPDLDVIWSQLRESTYIVSGEQHRAKRVIYVFFDPDCGYCHALWLALKPYEAAGLQVRWIPVAILGSDSTIKAAAVIDGGEPVFTQLQQAFEGGFGMSFRVTEDLQSKLDENHRLMRAAQIRGTPGILYKDASGHVMKCGGMPKLSALPAITGLPAQPETDPRATRFR